jgi:hypothetical protein
MVASSTLKKYENMMELLKSVKINAIKNPEKLLDWFQTQKYSISARKVYLSAIKYFHPDTFPIELQEQIDELYQAQNERDTNQKLTSDQEKSYIPWENVLNLQQKLAEKEDKTKQLWLEYLVVSLYTLNAPVRNDYSQMKVYETDNPERTGNELIMDEKPHFVFREYKTAKIYKSVSIDVNPELLEVILEWFGFLGDVPEYLLGKKYSKTTIGNLLQDTFKKRLGRSQGITLLRHSYISFVYPKLNTIKEKQKVAGRMLHSTNLQEQYRVINSNE